MPSQDSATQQKQLLNTKETHPVNVLSLNDVFRESIKRVQAAARADLIIRCEQLPQVKGQKAELEELFTLLIGMIVDKKTAGSKQFLYIDCEDPEKNGKDYLIKIHTNSSTNESWKEANRDTIHRCERILEAHHGSLTVNNIQHTGCLFLIALPGKFE